MGYENLRKPQIASEVARLSAEIADKAQVDATLVLTGLKREAQLPGDGVPNSARIRALELLGKHLGMFTGPDTQTPPPSPPPPSQITVTDAERVAAVELILAAAARRAASPPPAG